MLLGDILHAVEGTGLGSSQRYWLLLGLQHHEHRSQSNNVIISLLLVMCRLPRPHQGRKQRDWVDAQQMGNVLSAIVLQLKRNLRLKLADWGFTFKEALRELCHRLITRISLSKAYLFQNIHRKWLLCLAPLYLNKWHIYYSEIRLCGCQGLSWLFLSCSVAATPQWIQGNWCKLAHAFLKGSS